MSFIYYFVSSERLGDVATSLLFPPLFIFGNEKQPVALKKIYTAYLKYKRTQNVTVAWPCPPTAHDNLVTAFQKGTNLSPEPYEEKLN